MTLHRLFSTTRRNASFRVALLLTAASALPAAAFFPPVEPGIPNRPAILLETNFYVFASALGLTEPDLDLTLDARGYTAGHGVPLLGEPGNPGQDPPVPAAASAATGGGFFDPVTYVGGVSPEDPWVDDGWTTFSDNWAIQMSHREQIGADCNMHNLDSRRDAVSTKGRLAGALVAVFAVYLIAAGAAVAQNGAATGMVLDGRSGTPVRSATVALDGGSASATTSVDGVFRLALPAGTHAVVVSAEGYGSQRVLDVVVEAGGLTQFSAVLMPAGEGAADRDALSETITVEAAAIDATAAALLAERKAAAEIIFPARQVLSVGLSSAHNSVTAGDPLLQDPAGLGSSGAGGQPLPVDFPDRAVVRQSRFLGIGFGSADLERMGEQIAGRWTPADRDDAPFGRGGKIAYGNTFGGFGVMLAGNWDDSFESRAEQRTFYSVGANDAIVPLHSYDFDYGVEQVRQSWMGNFTIRAGDSGQIEIRSLRTNLSMSEARFQEGFFSDINNDIEDRRLQYEDQEISNLQIGGDHYLSGVGSNGSTLTWRGSSSTAETHEDLRQTIYELFDDGFRLTNNGQIRSLSDTQNLRFSLSRTVNRPEFREVAPAAWTSSWRWSTL